MMIMSRHAAFLAGLIYAAAAPSFAQTTLTPDEDDLLGGPDAPITLRAPSGRQTTPNAIAPVIKPLAPPKAIVGKPAPKPISPPRIAAAPKPVARPAEKAPQVARITPPSSPLRAAPTAPAPVSRALDEPRAIAAAPELPAFEPEPEVQAEPAPPARDYAEPLPDRAFAQVDRLIERAVRNGDINPRTANEMYDDLVAIADHQDALMRDDAFDAEARAQTEARLTALQDDLAAARAPRWGASER